MSLGIADSTADANSKMMGVLFFLSCCIALLSFDLPLAQDFHIGNWPTISLGIVWLLLFTISLVRYGMRALWLLIGAPFALIWPYLNFMFWACEVLKGGAAPCDSL